MTGGMQKRLSRGKSACNLEGSAARAVTAECTTAFLDLISFAVLQFQILRTRDPERPAPLCGLHPGRPAKSEGM